eukprot:3223037-Amphidinium_carterae.2
MKRAPLGVKPHPSGCQRGACSWRGCLMRLYFECMFPKVTGVGIQVLFRPLSLLSSTRKERRARAHAQGAWGMQNGLIVPVGELHNRRMCGLPEVRDLRTGKDPLFVKRMHNNGDAQNGSSRT